MRRSFLIITTTFVVNIYLHLLSPNLLSGSLGGLGSLTLAGFSNPAASQQLGDSSAAVAAAAQQLLSMQAEGQSKTKTKLQKKKKLKTSHPVATTTKPVELPSASAATPPVSGGVPSLAGISPYLLPTQGGVFYSPFLASHNVQGLISSTTAATTTSTTTSLDNNDSQSSVDSKFNRTDAMDTGSEKDVTISDGALGTFADDNDDNTFAGVDLGDIEGELDENVITDIAMDEEEET